MGIMHGFLCRLSPARLAQLKENPSLIAELAEARADGDIPGMLDLDKAWHALDVILAHKNEQGVLGDAILARGGSKFGPPLSFGPARLLEPNRVKAVADALGSIPEDLVRQRYADLKNASVHGGYGAEVAAADDPKYLKDKTAKNRETEIAELTSALEGVCELYREAAAQGHAMLVGVV